MHGALRCLTLLFGDLDDIVVPKLAPVLFPCSHTIVSFPQIYDEPLLTKSIFNSLCLHFLVGCDGWCI